MDKLAAEHADWVRDGQVTQRGAVRVVNVEYGAATALCQQLGIVQLPTIHLYAAATKAITPQQRLAKIHDMVCAPRDFPIIRDWTETYVNHHHTANTAFAETLKAGGEMIENRLAALDVAPSESEVPAATTTTTRSRSLWRLWRRTPQQQQP